MFTAQPGFRGVIFSRSEDAVAVLSFWDDHDAVEALSTSETYLEAVNAIGDAGFLTSDSTLEVFEIHDAVTKSGQVLFEAS